MIEISSAIGLLIALYFCRSDKPKNVVPRPDKPTKQDYGLSYFCPATTEIKSLCNRGASCSIYMEETVKAFSFHYGKGGRPITQDEFNSLDFHATRGGVWKREINNIDGTRKEVIDLMPTLNLPPPSPSGLTPARIPKRDYRFRVY